MRHRHHTRTNDRRIGSGFTSATALFAVIVVALLFLAAACGGSVEPASTTAVTGTADTGSSSTISTSSTPSTAASTSLGAEDLGDQIGVVYVGALRDVALALKDKPDVAGVRNQIEQMKNDAVSKLVELGRAREAMSAADRAKVDARITAALSAAGGEDWYATYNEAWTHYSSVDTDFANLIAAFNVIGQYANFDLLKQQAPEEAARLGIK